jgi:MSHA pilin protein MshC
VKVVNDEGGKRGSARSRGFTLVELVTVLVLLGIVTAVAAPRFFENQVFSERGYANELAGALRHAQQVALASNCNVRLRITAAGYSAFQRNNFATCRTASAWSRPVLRPDGVALNGAPPNGVAATPATFQFTSAGTVINPPVVTVGAFTLSVDAASGRVTVQ